MKKNFILNLIDLSRTNLSLPQYSQFHHVSVAHFIKNHNLLAPNPLLLAISLLSSSCLFSSATEAPSLLSLRSSKPNPCCAFPSSDALDLGEGGGEGKCPKIGEGNRDDGLPKELSDSTTSPLVLLLSGWRLRVTAKPRFPFKILMEEFAGECACALGGMASRPNFGLHKLDFVFSSLIVGSILILVLMYLLAPISAFAATTLISVFATCPPSPSHIFDTGPYSFLTQLARHFYLYRCHLCRCQIRHRRPDSGEAGGGGREHCTAIGR